MDPLLDSLKVSTLNYARGYMAAAMQEAAKVKLPACMQRAQAERCVRDHQLAILKQAVDFVGRVHMFVGGLDLATRDMFAAVSDVWDRVMDGNFCTQQQQQQQQQKPAAAAAKA